MGFVIGGRGEAGGFLVQELAFCGEAIFRPSLLVVDQGALARAVEEMLKGGEGDGLDFSGHESMCEYCLILSL